MKKYWMLFFVLGVHLLFLMSLQFTAWPEMFSFPYLRNNNFLLYKDLIHPYTPILTMALSTAYGLFGYKLWVMQVFAWSMALSNSLLIFLITKKLSKKKLIALTATIFYLLTQPFLEGNMLWPDTAMVTPILLSTYFLLNRRIFWGGVFMAIAALTKQTAGLFLIAGGFWLLLGNSRVKSIYRWSIGSSLLGGVFFVRLLTEKAFIGFLNSTLIYPSRFWTKFPGYVQMGLNQRQVVILSLLFLPIIILFWKQKSKIFRRRDITLILLFLISSIIVIYPRFSFFHFQVALAFLAILVGFAAGKINMKRIYTAIYLLLLLVVVALPIIRVDWGKETRFYNQSDLGLANIIRNNTPDGETVYLLGAHSANYVFAEVLPPKRWVDNFGWYFEVPGEQDQTIAQWNQNSPGVIFWQEPKPGNWYDLGTYQPEKVTDWIEENYTKGQEVQDGLWLWQKN